MYSLHFAASYILHNIHKSTAIRILALFLRGHVIIYFLVLENLIHEI